MLQQTVESAEEKGYSQDWLQTNGRLAVSVGTITRGCVSAPIVIVAYNKLPSILEEEATDPHDVHPWLTQVLPELEAATCSREVIKETPQGWLVVSIPSGEVDEEDFHQAVEKYVVPSCW